MADPATNLSKVQQTSTLKGLGSLPPLDGTITINSFSLGATTASSTFSTTLVPTTAIAAAGTLTQVKFSGINNTDRNNTWVAVYGSISFQTDSLSVGVIVQRSASGIVVKVQYYNATLGSVTVPNQTITIRCYPYTGPWS